MIKGTNPELFARARYHKSFMHNLSSYRSKEIAFDIERHIASSRISGYSFMITSAQEYRSNAQLARRLKAYMDACSEFEGLVQTGELTNSFAMYRKKDGRFYTNFMASDKIVIGVISDGRFHTLDDVVELLPEAARLFGKVSSHEIDAKAMEKLILLAREGDKIRRK